MTSFYGQDLAYIQAAGFGRFAHAAAEILRLLKTAAIPIRRVVDLGCGAGVLSGAMLDAGLDVTGVDRSDDLLAIDARHVRRGRFVSASIYDFDLPASQPGRISNFFAGEGVYVMAGSVPLARQRHDNSWTSGV